MSAFSRPLLMLLLFSVGLELFVILWFRGPHVISEQDGLSAGRFSAEAALKLHEELFPNKPHPSGSEENDEVRRRIVEWLEQQGWVVESVDTIGNPTPEADTPESDIDQRTSVPQGLTVFPKNIVAYRPEQQALMAQPLVLASHYDSCPYGPGAGDAAACVVSVLEVGRLLTRDASALQRPIWLLLTDAEETGLRGARHFVATHPLSERQPLVLNLDARGNSGPAAMFETHPGNSTLTQRFVNSLARPRLTGSLYTTVYRMLPNGTDFTVFRDAGWQGFNFALIDGAHHYHQPTDTLENLDPRSVQHLGETAFSVAADMLSTSEMWMASADDAVFFDLLGWHVFVIPGSWNSVLRFVILFAAVQLYGRRLLRDRALSSVIQVWITMAVVLPFAGLIGWLFSSAVRGTQILPVPFVAHGHWLSAAGWLCCAFSVGLLCRYLLRRIAPCVIWNSFWLAHAAVCMLMAVMLPEVSYVLTIPALTALVATALFRDLTRRTLVTSCLTALMLIPLQHLIAIALGPANGMLLFPVFALLIMPAFPLFGIRNPAGG